MRKAVIVVLGAFVGLAFVRGVVLDPVEIIAWRIFWNLLQQGAVADFGLVLESTTFWKSVGGMIIGGSCGLFAAARIATEPTVSAERPRACASLPPSS
jgi:hypothetical protein